MRALSCGSVLFGCLVASAFTVAACGSKNTDSGFGAGAKPGTSPDGAVSGDPSGDTNPAEADDAGGLKSSPPDAAQRIDLDSGCATSKAVAKRAPVYMLFVVDGSGSMGSDNKWVSERAALHSVFDEMAKTPDPSFGVGLILYSDSTGYGPPFPNTGDVNIAVVDTAQRDRLKNRLPVTEPGILTPTLAALKAAYGVLSGFDPKKNGLEVGGKKIVVLSSDGSPTDDDAYDMDPANSDCKKAAAQNLAAAPPGGPIYTFGIGIGVIDPTGYASDYDPVFMGNLVVAGGTRMSPTCNPNEAANKANFCHLHVTPGGSATQLTQDFINAINKIRGVAAACEYTLDTSGTVDPNKVNVIFTDGSGNETWVMQDPTNGWVYDDPAKPTKVLLKGSACDKVKADAKGEVRIVLGCKTQVN